MFISTCHPVIGGSSSREKEVWLPQSCLQGGEIFHFQKALGNISQPLQESYLAAEQVLSGHRSLSWPFLILTLFSCRTSQTSVVTYLKGFRNCEAFCEWASESTVRPDCLSRILQPSPDDNSWFLTFPQILINSWWDLGPPVSATFSSLRTWHCW